MKHIYYFTWPNITLLCWKRLLFFNYVSSICRRQLLHNFTKLIVENVKILTFITIIIWNRFSFFFFFSFLLFTKKNIGFDSKLNTYPFLYWKLDTWNGCCSFDSVTIWRVLCRGLNTDIHINFAYILK